MASSSLIAAHFRKFRALDADEEALLESLELDPQPYPAGSFLCQAGTVAAHFFTLMEGWAGAIRHFADGRRQVLDLYLPGQVMRLRELGSEQAQSDLVALTDVVACPFPGEKLSELLLQAPRLAETLLMIMAGDQALLTERITNIARRPAPERLGHFLLELGVRLGGRPDQFELPLNQSLIGDLLGLSAVHISRTFSLLRREGLISCAAGSVRILDLPALRERCGFRERYLSQPRIAATQAESQVP